MMYGLTEAQLEVYDFICAEFEKNRIPPSYEEIRQNVGLKSKSRVHRIVQALKQRGCIADLPGHARSMRPVFDITRHPGDVTALAEILRYSELGISGQLPERAALRAIGTIARAMEAWGHG